jgi:hypothetical protein
MSNGISGLVWLPALDLPRIPKVGEDHVGDCLGPVIVPGPVYIDILGLHVCQGG